MKSMSKKVKVNSLTLAKNAAQFLTRIEFDLHPLLQDKTMKETLGKITEAIGKLEEIAKNPDKSNSAELTNDFQKTDKSLEKMKTKVNDFQLCLEKVEKILQENLQAKLDILKATDTKDSSDADNRNKVEISMKSIKNLVEVSKKKLQEVQAPTETALKKLHAIKPKLYALGIPKTFESCQKRAEKLNEDIETLCRATAEMSLSEMVIASAPVLFKDAAPTKLFLPKLQCELEKSSKLIHQTGLNLRRLFPLSDAGMSAAVAADAGRIAVGSASSVAGSPSVAPAVPASPAAPSTAAVPAGIASASSLSAASALSQSQIPANAADVEHKEEKRSQPKAA